MAKIEFSKEEKTELEERLRRYFEEELDHELGGFEAEFLLDFISEHFGAYYYNQGLRDAGALLAKKLEDITDALYEIERPTTLLS